MIVRACIDQDADLAARLLHNHLMRTANVVSQAIGATTLFAALPES